MLGRVTVLVALPISGLLAQATEVQIRITAANNAAYRIVNAPADTGSLRQRPIVGRGEAMFTYRAVDKGQIAIAAVDSVSRIHLEASEGGRVIATAEGPYVAVMRDSTGHVMVAASGSVPRDPFAFSRRKPTESRP